jgi:hypothetical protein
MTWLPRSPGSTLVLRLNQETVHDLSSPHLEASPATTFRTCSSPAPTPVKPQQHLQYLAKNQSTQRCQSLITQGSDHPPVLESHMVLNLPLDECIDNTHTKVTREKRKETNKKKLQQAIESRTKAESKIT